ncbi:MAG: DUF3089 domain-containing protein, partial [Acidimicrobiales bacterium]|nr:DUF3089 domain-containing protein [Acidimicrobiales bacterium]
VGLVLAGCTSSGSEGSEAPEDDPTGSDAPTDEDATPGGEPIARYAGYESVSYDDASHWVCRPDADDICDGDLDATVVEADGTLTVEPFEAAADPAIDCFYVYPTISKDPGTYSDWDAADDEEGWVTVNQAARLQSECRLFAPVYRQRTLVGLGGGGDPEAEGDPYADVLDAFSTYMANDNGGRGVVLIGHSQGTGMLAQLIAGEFEEDAELRELLVGAYLAGGGIAEPGTGGAFAEVPVCATDGEAGCIASWASFRSDAPPPDGTFFGVTRTSGEPAVCVSPSAFAGGDAPLDAYFPAVASSSILSPEAAPQQPSDWVDAAAGTIDTPFVKVPGLLSGTCEASNGANVLLVDVAGDPADPRADDIPGDLTPEWGLHLVDVNLVMGDVVRQVATQADAWAEG